MAFPIDVVIVGTALNTFGLTHNNTISGLALNTFGFLTPCSGIWSPSDDPITTTWVSSSCGNGGTVEDCAD